MREPLPVARDYWKSSGTEFIGDARCEAGARVIAMMLYDIDATNIRVDPVILNDQQVAWNVTIKDAA